LGKGLTGRLGYASVFDLFLGLVDALMGFGSLNASGPAALMMVGHLVGE